MLNVNKLKGKIIEKGHSVTSLSELMGVDKATLYRKMSDQGNFTVRDIDQIAEYLDLSVDEVNSIFFTQFFA